MAEFGDFLKLSGISQVDLAEKLKIHKSTLGNYATGKAVPPSEVREKIAEYTGYSWPDSKSAKPITSADLAELRGWMSAHFEQAHREREALAEILRALAVEIRSLKSDQSGKK